MGRLFLTSLAPATGTIYCCKHCDSHLAYAQHIISKMFRCKHGKAYLFDKVVNVVAGESEDDRMMTTGLHTVRDIFCVACGAILGWKYVSAFEKDQRYKEGKFILERCKIHSGGGGPPDRIQLWAEHDARISSSEDDDQGAV
ncbi:protein yippee-like [Triticum urartu]|uniref:Protein yippee-like n=2 Tax=Triticum TaxID=4564 RepID=A0A9R0TGS2_TRITD|nr:protein yippee-like [Triticum urartu]VAI11990.1 unnamed protein product [Triticum turgidum subsp. durum]